MGRGKIEIKKIENANSRQVTFSKRRNGLFKKARELAILCDADVAVIIFSNTGKLFEYASSSVTKTISRYNNVVLETKLSTTEECKKENEEPQDVVSKEACKELDILREELGNLRLKQMQLLGKDLTGMGVQELHKLEVQLNEGLVSLKERKEQLLMQELSESQMKEHRAILENEMLRKQVEQLQNMFPSASINLQLPLRIEQPSSAEHSGPVVKERSGSLETPDNGRLDVDDDDSDTTTLHLGPPSGNPWKRKRMTVNKTYSGSYRQRFELENVVVLSLFMSTDHYLSGVCRDLQRFSKHQTLT